LEKRCVFEALHKKLNEDRPTSILSAAKCRPTTLVSEIIPKRKTTEEMAGQCVRRLCGLGLYADIRGGSSGRGQRASNDSGVVIASGGYFFGNFREKARLIWRYVITCRPVIDCKINYLE